MRYYLLSGKRSADVHAAQLVRALRQADEEATFRSWGGEHTQQADGEVVRHYHEVVPDAAERWLTLAPYRRSQHFFREDLAAWQPHAVVLVDFDGLNFRLARVAQSLGVPLYGYVSPRPWAWNGRRVQMVRAYLEHMYVTLPFEASLYRSYGCPATFVGHPSHEAAAHFRPSPTFHVDNGLDGRPIIAAMPGSSAQEVSRSIHFMLSILPPFMDYQFVVAALSSVPRACYEPYRRNNIKIVYDQSFDLLHHARAAMVSPGLTSTSDDRPGSASLECALFNVPQVICYRNSYPTYLAVRTLAKIRHFSIVNLLVQRGVVRELVQDNFTPANLMTELELLLHSPERRAEISSGYAEALSLLGPPTASHQTARSLYRLLRKQGAPAQPTY